MVGPLQNGKGEKSLHKWKHVSFLTFLRTKTGMKMSAELALYLLTNSHLRKILQT